MARGAVKTSGKQLTFAEGAEEILKR